MTAPQRGFEIAEFASRCTKAQLAMAASDIGVLLLTSEADIRYFTGFMTQFWQSPTRPWFVLIPASGKPVAIIPSIGVPLMRDCYIGDLQSWPSPAADDDGITLLISVIRNHLGGTGRLGMMMGRETAIRMPFNDLRALQGGLDGIAFCDMTNAIQHIRMVKSPAEQAKLTHICRLVSGVFADVPQWVKAGMPLDDLFRQFKIQALTAGVDDVSYLLAAQVLMAIKTLSPHQAAARLPQVMYSCLIPDAFGMAISVTLTAILPYIMPVMKPMRRITGFMMQPKRRLIFCGQGLRRLICFLQWMPYCAPITKAAASMSRLTPSKPVMMALAAMGMVLARN